MRRRAGAWVGVAFWLLSLSAATSIRARVWQSDRALWADAAAKAPQKPRPVLNDGRAHELSGDPAYAETAYRKAIGLSFDGRRSAYVRRFTQAAGEVNLAHLRMARGEMASAMQILDQVLEEWPAFPYAAYNKGSILWAFGYCDDAIVEFKTALAGDPTLPPPKQRCAPRSSTP